MAEDLATWLLEQIADDERAARDAQERTTISRRMIRGEMVNIKTEPRVWQRSVWPPERVLAECGAKRQLVARAQRSLADAQSLAAAGAQRLDVTLIEAPATWTLVVLALPYADRVGYREEWRP